jgi:hypothetical protein
LADEKRRKARRPKIETPEDDVILDQATTSDPAVEDNLGVNDYYAPSEKTDDPAS